MKDHLDIMRMVKRKRLSEDRLRKLNMYEIAEEIHGLEDSNKVLLEALETIQPHLGAIICYVSTTGEHEPNRIAKMVEDAIKAARS